MIISDCSNPRSRLANRSDRTYLCVTSRYGGKPCQFMNITANTAATNLISSLWATIATWTVPFARGVLKNWCQHFPLAMTITSAATCRRRLDQRCAPIVRTHFKNVFWPNIFVGAWFSSVAGFPIWSYTVCGSQTRGPPRVSWRSLLAKTESWTKILFLKQILIFLYGRSCGSFVADIEQRPQGEHLCAPAEVCIIKIFLISLRLNQAMVG